jgi:arylsulfatase
MKKSNFYWLPFLTVTLFLGVILTSTRKNTSEIKQEKPNILVILTDDMGYSDIGCFGSEIKTPHIDRLAYNGLRFTHFYNTGRCSPTRASLLTGLYPHQAGMGHLSTENHPQAGYIGDLSKNAVTLAEVLKNAGYATFMTGKWHVAKENDYDGDKSNWPLQRGFDRFFGTLNGSGSFFDPGTLTSGNNNIPPYKGFYYTSAISDTTVKYIRESPSNKPFFGYIAYTAAHWPLHAPADEVKKYKGFFDKGWDVLREQRFKRLKELGIIDDAYVLTDRGVSIPAWKDEPMKEWQIRRMEVYAAMIDIMDQGIGKIISALEAKGVLDNTLIFYMHDNGGCAEPVGTDNMEIPLTEEQKVLKPYAYDSPNPDKKQRYTREGKFIRMGKGVMPGESDTWTGYNEEWANVSNTPFREYKQWVHEGGIASPLVIHWPKGIKSKGQLRPHPSHLIDIMATCLDISGIPYPNQFKDNNIQPLEGKSLLPAFQNKPINREYLFWEHGANRAIRVGDWKLVSKTSFNKSFSEADEDKWELYDLIKDPTERIDLREKNPEKAMAMIKLYREKALYTKALPWPWKPKK